MAHAKINILPIAGLKLDNFNQFEQQTTGGIGVA